MCEYGSITHPKFLCLRFELVMTQVLKAQSVQNRVIKEVPTIFSAWSPDNFVFSFYSIFSQGIHQHLNFTTKNIQIEFHRDDYCFKWHALQYSYSVYISSYSNYITYSNCVFMCNFNLRNKISQSLVGLKF